MVETKNTSDESSKGGLVTGVSVIESYLRTLPAKAGVYRMIAAHGGVLYVGKAKDLKKRVANYTHPERLTVRIRRMVALTAAMEFVTTHTEAEALLLEANLIKQLAPRYNILLRDDKNFPEILLSASHVYPRVVKHRGAHKPGEEYFGPFASASAVNETLAALQRAFLLRTCTDSVFANRTRPCLLYQIKRCSAPCAEGLISRQDYGSLVDEARSFLAGKSQAIQKRLAVQMQKASDEQAFELAARLRDRIRALTQVQHHQDINLGTLKDADVVALYQRDAQPAVQVFFYRGGRNYGSRVFFPTQAGGEVTGDVLEAFLGQFYAKHDPPGKILISHDVKNADLMAEALGVRAGRKVKLIRPVRGERFNLVKHALHNARDALARRIAERATQEKMLAGLADVCAMEAPPQRIEVYDNSHISGAHAVGAMIVAGPDGFEKSAYRKFNIRGARNVSPAAEGFQPGDDYAMMHEVLTRRFQQIGDGPKPDLLLIDGGRGQLGIVLSVVEECGVEGITVAGVAKGPERNAGRERIFLPDQPAKALDDGDPVLYFIQRLRDEAHRFAIGTHRARRAKAQTHSRLDDIPSVGAKRKKALLYHFGSAKAVEEAGLVDMEAVDGISKAIARRIYDWFHPGA